MEVEFEGADPLVGEVVVQGCVGVVEVLVVGDEFLKGGSFGWADFAVVGVVGADYLDMVQTYLVRGLLYSITSMLTESSGPELKRCQLCHSEQA